MNVNGKQKVKRGEFYYYDFGKCEGSIQSGVRPVLVVQCEGGNKASTTTIIAAVTSVAKKRYLPSHIFLGEHYGLKKPSMLMLEQLRTVNQADLTEYIGYVDDLRMQKLIDNALKKALGLWNIKPTKQTQDVRCFCSKCLKEYMANTGYIIRRLDPFCREKSRCDKCLENGYSYIITEKTKSKVVGDKKNERV